LLERAVRDQRVLYAKVIGPTGAVLAQVGEPTLLERPFLADHAVREVRDGVFDVHAPLLRQSDMGKAHMGSVQMGLETGSAAGAVRNASSRVLWGALAAVLLSGLLIWHLTRRLKAMIPLPKGKPESIHQATLTQSAEQSATMKASDRQNASSLAGFNEPVADSATPNHSRLLSVISREIRTPMNDVLGALALLSDSELDRRQREWLASAQSSSKTLWNVVNDVLDVARLEAGDLDLNPSLFSPSGIVEEVVEGVADRARSKGIEVASFVDPALPKRVLGDPLRLKQVLMNLLENAVKFTQHGGVVLEVSVDKSRQHFLCFEVIDTGVGISDSERESLFQGYEELLQSEGEAQAPHIGLSLSRRVVELMGGALDFVSEVGKGSRFFFNMPTGLDQSKVDELQEQMESVNQDAVVSPERLSKLQGMRFLLVDDNDSSRSAYERQLRSWGVEVDTVSSGPDAVHVLKDAKDSGNPYDLAILDLDMPEMDGVELVDRIRGLKDFSTMTLVSMVAEQDAGKPLNLDAKGFDAFLVKPVRQGSLAHWLASALERQHQEKQAHHRAANPSADGAAAGMPILLAEDSAANRIVATSMLKKAGFEVEVVENGALALAQAKERDWGLILMDLQMPVMDGLSAAQQIREIPGQRGTVPIIAVTANVFPEDRQACAEAGMNEVVSKPIRRDNLISAVQRWLRPIDSLGQSDNLDLSVLRSNQTRIGEPGMADIAFVFLMEIQRRLDRLQELDDDQAIKMELRGLEQAARGFGARGLAQFSSRLQGGKLDSRALNELNQVYAEVRKELIKRYKLESEVA
jgi:CheY-like chemotaxis protein